MDRLTIRLPQQQIEQIKILVRDGEYPSKSELIRSAIRQYLRDVSNHRFGL